MHCIVGIDYGSKTAGTTVLAIMNLDDKSIHFLASEKGRNADQFILNHLEKLEPEYVFVDAPLSLPGFFHHQEVYVDHMYRQCDRLLGAMSPMFIGGLSARAIKLKCTLRERNIEVRETYPAVWAKRWELKKIGYKKKLSELPKSLAVVKKKTLLNFFPEKIASWHHLDSLLCLYSAFRYQQGIFESFGDPKEGIIII